MNRTQELKFRQAGAGWMPFDAMRARRRKRWSGYTTIGNARPMSGAESFSAACLLMTSLDEETRQIESRIVPRARA